MHRSHWGEEHGTYEGVLGKDRPRIGEGTRACPGCTGEGAGTMGVPPEEGGERGKWCRPPPGMQRGAGGGRVSPSF